MKPYADTNFFTGLLVDVPQSAVCATLIGDLAASGGGPLPVTWLLRFELANALQRLVFEARTGNQNIRVTSEFALMAEAQFLAALEHGDSWARQNLAAEKLEHIFMSLVARHTAKHGFRTYDIIHVASALVLGCDTFWSFDTKARKLAKLEGLKLN